nr:hypothetical protein [Tanacetum cinerariifolium]
MDGRRRYWKPLEDHGRLEALRNPRSFYPWKIVEYSSNVDLVETKCHMEDHCRYNSVTSGIRVSQFEAMENEGQECGCEIHDLRGMIMGEIMRIRGETKKSGDLLVENSRICEPMYHFANVSWLVREREAKAVDDFMWEMKQYLESFNVVDDASKIKMEMEERDMTMEEYVQYETEKALRNAIVYDDALSLESCFSSEPTVSPQYVDRVNLKKETSLSKYDDDEYNVISYNDLFPFNIISVNDSKLDTGNDDNSINIKKSLWDISIKPL